MDHPLGKYTQRLPPRNIFWPPKSFGGIEFIITKLHMLQVCTFERFVNLATSQVNLRVVFKSVLVCNKTILSKVLGSLQYL